KLDDQAATANGSGVANFSGVKAGSHSLEITADGQQPYSTDVQVDGGEYKLVKASSMNPLMIVVVLLVIGVGGGAVFFGLKLLRRPPMPVSNVVAPTS